MKAINAKYQQDTFVFDCATPDIAVKKGTRAKRKAATKKKLATKFMTSEFMAILFPEDYPEEYIQWIHNTSSITWVEDDVEAICNTLFKDALFFLRRKGVSDAIVDDVLSWIFDPEGEPVETDFAFKNVCKRLFGVSERVGQSAILMLIQRTLKDLNPKKDEYRIKVFKEVLRMYSDDIDCICVNLSRVEQQISLMRQD